MSRMENTGFFEITEERVNFSGPGFWFCEIAVTGLCNFHCEYCNRLNSKLDFDKVCGFIDSHKGTLRHVHLTGGEPTLYPRLQELCYFIKSRGIKLGISTNGSAEYLFYESLKADMFSISLDDYSEASLIKRGYGDVSIVKDNIYKLSKNYYVNVGIVVDRKNCERVEKIISYVLNLGVKDIKLSINTKDLVMPTFGNTDYSAYPILNYRVNRFRHGKTMTGIQDSESFKCALVLNDISIVDNKHYPCLVYAREGGIPIGTIDSDVEETRKVWYDRHQPNFDPICKKYCMDFKCEFNRCRQKLLNNKS